jgi:transposase
MMTSEEAEKLVRLGSGAVLTVILGLEKTIDSQQKEIVGLQGTVDALRKEAVGLQESVSLLTRRIADLEKQIGKNSSNSSKPPSTDGFKKPPSKRTKTGKPSGAQKGHPGRTLEFCDKPDHIVEHSPVVCEGCGESLSGVDPIRTERRQVFDVPPVEVEVTEHHINICSCPNCGTVNRAQAPEGVNQPVQYGPRIQALGAYLVNYQLLPLERTAELMEDVFGVHISEGTLCSTTARAAKALEGVEAAIVAAIKEAPVVHMDETGQRINGKLTWLHVASTIRLTYYSSQSKRGKVALDNIGILTAFTGTAVHDGWGAYSGYPCNHSLCNAHHLRELTAVHEQPGQAWAGDMIELLRDMKKEVRESKERGEAHLPQSRLLELEALYDEIIKAGYAANPPPAPTGKRGRQKQGVVRCLLIRLDQKRSSVLAFMHDPAVPFDNNQAERDLRMMKVKQKISGGFRSEDGAKNFNRIRGYISTIRKQPGNKVLAALQSVFLGKPMMPDLMP